MHSPFHTYALEAVSRNFHVFPLIPGTKRPLFKGWQDRATQDRRQIERWGSGESNYNIGIACGPSQLVVIDLDAPKQPGQHHGRDVLWDLMQHDHIQWVPTYTQMTPNDGVHLIYRAPRDLPLGNSASQVGENIDIRATGGYVVAAGSIIDGNPYIVNNDLPVADLPADLLTMMMKQVIDTRRNPASSVLAPRADLDGYEDQRIQEGVDEILRASEGRRNNVMNAVTYRLARLCGGGVLDEVRVADAMLRAGTDAGLSQAECSATVKSAMNAGMAHPRTLIAVPDLASTELSS